VSSLEENKAVARRWLDLVSAHDVEGICAMTAPSWTMHGGPPALPAGHEGVRQLFRTIGPVGQSWTVEDVIAEANRVALRATNSCEQESFFGVPGRGVRQTFSAMFILHIADGMVLETWRNADDLGRLFQLGARIVPPATG